MVSTSLLSWRFALAILLVSSASHSCCAKTVALWSFDEPVGTGRDALVKDASGNGYDLQLGDGKIVVEGRFGNAMHCPAQISDYVARRLDVQNTPLNLGNFDWTIEWWQRREGPVAKGHVDWIFLLCDESVNPANPHWEAGFQSEARFTGAGLWMHDNVVTWQRTSPMWPCFGDKYDEVPRVSFVQDVHPSFYSGSDDQFHHVAWVYDASIKRLMYFEDGKGPFMVRDGSAVAPGNQTHAVYGMLGSGSLKEYPEAFHPYGRLSNVALYIGGQNVIGPTAATDLGVHKIPRGYEFAVRSWKDRSSGSLIDEVRISDEVVYREPFSPPGSFVLRDSAERRLDVSPRRLQFLSTSINDQPAPQRFNVKQTGGVNARVHSNVDWLSITKLDTANSTDISQFEVKVDPTALWESYHTGRIIVRSDESGLNEQTIDITYNVQLENVAAWLFDEPLEAPQRMPLEDESRNGFDLALGPGGRIVEGLFRRALDPRSRRQGHAAVQRYIDSTHLNLGDHNWTWEGWLRLDEPARSGDVIFQLCENLSIGPYPRLRAIGDQTSLSVDSKAKGLLFRCDAVGIEQALNVESKVLRNPSEQWFHFALGYDSLDQALTLWINGKLQQSVRLSAPLKRLRPTGENTLSVGSTVEGKHRWPGLIDEMRVTASRLYEGNFTPPENFAAVTEPIELSIGPQLFVDDHLIAESENVRRTFYQADYPVEKPADWDDYVDQLPNRGDVHMADLGPSAADPAKRFLKYSYAHSYSESEQLGGIYCYYSPSRNGPWIAYDKNPVLRYVWAGMPRAYHSVSDHWPVIYDDRTQQLALIYKTYPLAGQNPVLDWYRDERFNYQNRVISGFRRNQGIAFSKDGLHWSGQQHVLVPDDWDEGETQFQTPKIYRRGDLYLAFVQLLRDDVDRSVASVALATSRDLYHWTRHRKPLLRHADEADRGDKWFHVAGNTELYVDEKRIVLPMRVGGSHKPPRAFYHGFCSVPLDRFASLDSTRDTTARIQTPLVRLPEDAMELRLNAETDVQGEVRVQFLDEHGETIAGFSLEDCEPVQGDHLSRRITWADQSNIDSLAGRNVRIEFLMKRARLFAFYLEPKGGLKPKDYHLAAKAQNAEGLSTDFSTRDLSTTEVRQLLDMPPDDAQEGSARSPSVVRIEHTYPKNLAYPGDPDPIRMSLEGQGPKVTWAIKESIPWLDVEPTEGHGPVEATLHGRGMQLASGDYLGKIRVVYDDDPANADSVPIYYRIRTSE